MKRLKKCPLFLAIFFSALLLTITGYGFKDTIYKKYNKESFLSPSMSLVFRGFKDGIYPWEHWKDFALFEDNILLETFSGNDGDSENTINSDQVSDNNIEKNENSENTISENGNGESSDNTISENDSSELSENTISENGSPEGYVLGPVTEDYFNDAVFIGDSRTQGMFEYGGISDRADFLCKTSLSIYDIVKKPKAIVKGENGQKITVMEALEKKQYGKVYLMLGINELGTGSAEYFYDEYARVVEEIRKLQPDAVIYVQGIMRVTASKSSTDKIFNNEKINERNEKLKELDNGKDIVYLEINDVVSDEEGGLYEDWTFDHIHLKAKYYQVWKEYLLQNGATGGAVHR